MRYIIAIALAISVIGGIAQADKPLNALKELREAWEVAPIGPARDSLWIRFEVLRDLILETTAANIAETD